MYVSSLLLYLHRIQPLAVTHARGDPRRATPLPAAHGVGAVHPQRVHPRVRACVPSREGLHVGREGLASGSV